MTEKEEKKERWTVHDALELFRRMDKAGYGDFTIKCKDAYLHKDEHVVCYPEKEFLILASVVYDENYMACTKLSSDIKKAMDRFFTSLK